MCNCNADIFEYIRIDKDSNTLMHFEVYEMCMKLEFIENYQEIVIDADIH